MQEERIIFLKNAIKQDPDEPFNYYALGLELIGSQNSFNSELKVDSGQVTADSGQVTADIGQATVDSGQLIAFSLEPKSLTEISSEKLFKYCLEKFPDYLPTYYQAANLFFELNLLDLADITYRNGIELAQNQQNEKTLKELQAAYNMFLDEVS